MSKGINPQLPAIVRERLRAAQQQDASPHPDAGMLTAFAEKSMSKGEREQMMAHLAVCRDCRQVVALAMPEPAGDLRPESGKWQPSLLLRWAVVSAAIAMAAVMVLVFLKPQSEPNVATANHPATPPQAVKPLPQAPVTPNDEVATNILKEASPPRDQVSGSLKKKSSPATTTANREALESVASNSSAGSAGKAGGGLQGANSSSSSLVAQSASNQFTAGANAATPPVAIEAKNLDVTSQPANSVSTTAATPAAGNLDRAFLQAKQSPPGAVQPSTAESATVEAEKTSSNAAAREQVQTLPINPLSWRVDREKLEVSRDVGASWQQVRSAGKHEFSAVDENANNVWAGTADGKLYQSADRGIHWREIPLPAEISAGAQPPHVVAINLQNFPRAEVTLSHAASTATSERIQEVWFTTDGGTTWAKNPQ